MTDRPLRGERVVHLLEPSALDALIDALRRQGYRVLGPTIRDHTVVYDDVSAGADLPVGWTDEQAPGSYRLARRDDGAVFGFVPGGQSWKPFLLPPETRLFQVDLRPGHVGIVEESAEAAPQAFIGARPCELRAIAVLDRVFLGGEIADTEYRRRRDATFVVGVNCAEPGGTCFCASLGTGPSAAGGYDLLLTEVCEGSGHFFVCESGSERGAELLSRTPSREATAAETEAAADVMRRARERMGRALETDGLQDLLQRNLEHAHWDAVASRCLACANCTMVCPTCFCADVIDETDLTGERGERRRLWDSCFTGEFSYIHGGRVRQSGAARYRQWITHKLASWVDQFGEIGCVGCGRCITWCPVGIDITAEVRALRDAPAPGE